MSDDDLRVEAAALGRVMGKHDREHAEPYAPDGPFRIPGPNHAAYSASYAAAWAETDQAEPETYLVGNWESGCAMLQCEREECRVPGNCASGSCFWTEDLPYHATWEQARDAYERHVANHLRTTT